MINLSYCYSSLSWNVGFLELEYEIGYVTENPKTTYFMYVENTRTGIMKRSGMDVDVLSPIQKLPIYSVSVFVGLRYCYV